MKALSNQLSPAPKPTVAVLYVEDEDANWDVVEARLGREFALQRARSAEEACEVLRGAEGRFSAVLMDIQLMGSELDGVELTMALKDRTPQSQLPAYARGLLRPRLPVIFVSAFASRHSENHLRSTGASGVVQKPVDFAKLSAALADSIHAASAP